jgi:hypothetical protein
MRKGTNKERDAELIKRLQEAAPEILDAKVDFDALVGNILSVNGSCSRLGPQRKPIKLKNRHKKA